MGPQQRLRIYVGFDSPSIIRYLEPLTGDVFIARFADCHFNENVFPPLRGEKSIPKELREITWNASTMSHFDPHTNQCELEVQRIIHLQNLEYQLSDAFINTKKVTKSHIPAANAPARIDVLEGQLVNESQIRLKLGRPISSKDLTPRKRRTQRKIGAPKEANIKQKALVEAYGKRKAPIEAYDEQKAPVKACGEQEALVEAYNEQKTHEEVQNKEITPKEAHVLENYEISMSYVHKGYKWD